MEYRRLGSTGLKVSALSYGAWVTFGRQVGRSQARELIALAYDRGINFFDNAETYNAGEAERLMGDVIAGFDSTQRTAMVVMLIPASVAMPFSCSIASNSRSCQYRA